MTLSIIIVNYNVKILLEQCLHSVANAIQSSSAEVFIVDNASNDGSIDYLLPKFPTFHFIRNEENTGFARANNQALQMCKGTYVLFLNPDTIVPADGLIKCITFLDSHSIAGALGVRMIDGNGNYLKESKRGLPTPMASLWKLTGISSLFPRSAFFSSYYAAHIKENETHEVDVLSGAFMMVRKKILDMIGGFDERFFMYAEDIDLSFRILRSGYKNYYFADITILHFKGSSTNKDTRYVLQFYKAMSQYVRKYYGNGMFPFLLDSGIFIRGSLAAFTQLFKRKKKIT